MMGHASRRQSLYLKPVVWVSLLGLTLSSVWPAWALTPSATSAATAPAILSNSTAQPAAVIEKKAGIEWVDRFRFLEAIDQSSTQQWMKTQHTESRQYLASLIQSNSTAQKASESLLAKEGAETSESVEAASARLQYVGKNLFYTHPTQPDSTVVYVRDMQTSASPERTLIDLQSWDVPAHSKIEGFRVSPNGRWIAVVIVHPDKRNAKAVGSKALRRQLLVADAKTGKLMIRPVLDVEATALLSWRPDSEAVFYVQRNELDRLQVVMRILAGDQAGKSFPVFGQNLGFDEALQGDEQLGVVTSPLSPYTLAVVRSPRGVRVFSTLVPQLSGQLATPIQNEQGTVQASEMRIVWHPLIQLQDKVSSFDLRGDWFYAITRRQQAQGELVRLRLSEPRWEEADLLISADAKQSLQQLNAAQDALYVERREENFSHLIKLPYNARYQNTGELQSLTESKNKVAEQPNVDTSAVALSGDKLTNLPTPSDLAKLHPIKPTDTAAAPSASTETSAAAEPASTEPKRRMYKKVKRKRVQYVRVSEVVTLPVVREASVVKGKKSKGKKAKHGHAAESRDVAEVKSGSRASRHHRAKQAHAQAKQSKHATKHGHKAVAEEEVVQTHRSSKGRHSRHGHHGKSASVAQESRTVVRHRLVRRVVEEEVPVEVKEAQEKRRARVRSRVVRLELSKTLPNIRTVQLPLEGTFQQLMTDPLISGVLVRVNDWANPLQMVSVGAEGDAQVVEGGVLSIKKGQQTAKTLEKNALSSNDNASVIQSQTLRLLVPADDTPDAPLLPLTLISRAGVNPINSKKPLLLILERPKQGVHAPIFREDVRIWLKKGGVVALANLFPQDVKEAEWLDIAHTVVDSRYVTRLENVVDYLYGEKIAQTNGLVAVAEGSNAGLLANAMIKHPTRFAATVLQSGVYDGLRWKSSEAKAGANEDEWKRLGEVSAYYQIKDQGLYPATLVLGSADPQVVIQAAKMSARLQQANTQNRAYFYSAARPLSDETRLLFLWNQIPQDE